MAGTARSGRHQRRRSGQHGGAAGAQIPPSASMVAGSAGSCGCSRRHRRRRRRRRGQLLGPHSCVRCPFRRRCPLRRPLASASESLSSVGPPRPPPFRSGPSGSDPSGSVHLRRDVPPQRGCTRRRAEVAASLSPSSFAPCSPSSLTSSPWRAPAPEQIRGGSTVGAPRHAPPLRRHHPCRSSCCDGVPEVDRTASKSKNLLPSLAEWSIIAAAAP